MIFWIWWTAGRCQISSHKESASFWHVIYQPRTISPGPGRPADVDGPWNLKSMNLPFWLNLSKIHFSFQKKGWKDLLLKGNAE